MNFREELKNDAAGLELLADWLGDGGEPVHPGDAELRASICVQCPENVAPKWWETAKGSIAEYIRKELELKSRFDLKTTNDEKLHMCRICGCSLPTKIWTPLEYIKKHVPSESLAKAPSFCWQKQPIPQETT